MNAMPLTATPAPDNPDAVATAPAVDMPVNRSRWTTPAVVVLMLVAGIVYALGIPLGLIHNYYGPAVYSMAHSWKAFFWGSFDGTTITMDKLPGAFWIQALSVRIFGWSNWSVLMPQVLQAVAAIGVLYATVRRWAGNVAGLLAAAALATTPVLAALAHSQIVDTQLLLLTICAAWAWTRAVQKGSGWWLGLTGVFIGLAFNAKMAQAWGVLPALALTYLLFAPTSRAKRWIHTAIAGVVTAVVSLWWVVVATLTPASSRPWIDGAADNSAWTMVFEYNLLGRYESGQTGPGGASGWSYLLTTDVATQVGWLYPAAVVSLALVLWDRRRAPKADLFRAATIMWGLWLTTLAVAFSTGRVAHSFYTVALAPTIVALTAAGAVVAWRRRTILAAAVLVLPTLAWTSYLSLQFSTFRSWTVPVAGGLALVGLVLLLVRRVQLLRRLAAATLVVAVLLTPAVWAASTMQASYSGASISPAAGPVGSMSGGPGGRGGDGGAPGVDGGQPRQGDARGPREGTAPTDGAQLPQNDGMSPQGGMPQGGTPPQDMGGPLPGGGEPPQMPTNQPGGQDGASQPAAQGGTSRPSGGQPQGGMGMGGSSTSQAASVLQYIAEHNPGSDYDLVALGYDTAGSYIEAGGRVISVGGFTGQMQNLTVDQLKALVAEKKVTFVMAGGGRGSSTGISAWVSSSCTAVDGYSGLYFCNEQ